MRARSWLLTVLLAVVLSAPVALMQERGGQEETGPYDVVANWPMPLADHDGWTWGSTGAVFAETPDRIWIAQRGELPLPADAKPFTPYGALNPSRGNATGGDDTKKTRGWERRYHHVLFVVNRDGKEVQYWQQHDKLFANPGARGPHKIKMSPYDPAKHVWVIDDNQHQIFKFTYDGKLVHTHGVRGEAGRGPNNFSRPTDIAWLPDGTYFISDGYVGVRVAKFDPNGKFLMDWGTKPVDPAKPGPNEFNTVHSVAVSKDRRVVVADRGHKRFQIFDENGKFLDQFPTGTYSSPYYHLITADQNIWVADGGTDQIVKYDLKGNFQYRWGSPGGQSGQLLGPHQLTIDQEGNLYAAEVYAGRVQKFRPKPKADPAKVVGQEVRLSSSN